MILVDTNVLLRSVESGHPHFKAASAAIDRLIQVEKEEICVAAQSFYEFYVVSTRPVAVNGRGLKPAAARAEIVKLSTLFRALPEQPSLFQRWNTLIEKYEVAGKAAHDARLVACMLEYQIPRLLTFNDGDFKRYDEITSVNPFNILDLPRT